MAARCLLIVMVILLVISTIVAALAPPPEEQGADEDDGETAARSDLDDPGWTGSPEGGGSASGAVLIRTVELGETVPLDAPAAIAVEAGDRLTLLVAGDRGAVISIPRLGRTETLSPSAPARFDLYLDSPGRYTVEEAESGREVATITVEEPPASPGEARDGRSRSRARARPGAEASRSRR